MLADPNKMEELHQESCHVCKDLLTHLQRFFTMIENAHKSYTSDWLTVEEIAKELKISKNVVYRLIRNGELEAVNIVETNGHLAQRGHYRIKRSCLKNYLEAKKVKASSVEAPRISRHKRYQEVKNHLGL